MKRLLERLQPLKAAVKSIFFISITVLVVIELVRLKRTITLESLESALASCFDGYYRTSRCLPYALL